MWNTLIEPLQFGFLRHAIVVCTIAGALCGLLGVFVTARRMAFFSETIAHSALAGVALGFLAGLALLLWKALYR